MKTKLNYLIKGLFAFAVIALFVQCKNDGAATQTASTGSENLSLTATAGDIKIAYVEMDTLLMNYNFWNDVTEAMMKRQEDMSATINQKARELEKEFNEFQRKIENNAFLSRERAEQEQSRLMKKRNDIEELQNKLAQELSTEAQKNDLEIRDAIDSFIQEYNKDKGYSFIISNTGNNSLLYANKSFNITQEIVDGLNAKYSSPNKK